MEVLYSKLNQIDVTVIQEILNKTSFDLTATSGVTEREVEGTYFYFIFTSEKNLIDPLRFAYDTMLEPIQIFNIKGKAHIVACFKARRQLSHEDVEQTLSQMVDNANHFRIPSEVEGILLTDYLKKLEKDGIPVPGEERIGMKLMFASGYLHHIGFNFEQAHAVQGKALELALEQVEQPRHLVSVGELKKLALGEGYFESLVELEKELVKE